MGVRVREGVLVSLASGVQRSFCSLEVSILETTILLNLLGFTPTWWRFWYVIPPLLLFLTHMVLWFPWISHAWEGPLPCMPAGLWILFSHLISASPVSESWAWVPLYQALSQRAFPEHNHPQTGKEIQSGYNSFSILIGSSAWKFPLLRTHVFSWSINLFWNTNASGNKHGCIKIL